jgi:hypothetical protein
MTDSTRFDYHDESHWDQSRLTKIQNNSGPALRIGKAESRYGELEDSRSGNRDRDVSRRPAFSVTRNSMDIIWVLVVIATAQHQPR